MEPLHLTPSGFLFAAAVFFLFVFFPLAIIFGFIALMVFFNAPADH